MKCFDIMRYFCSIGVMIVLTLLINNCAPTPVPQTTSIPKNAVVISIQTADTKAEWLRAATDSFNKAGIQISQSHPIYVEVLQEESPGAWNQSIQAGTFQTNDLEPG